MQRSAILTAVPHGRGRTRQVTIRNVGDEVALELGIRLMAEQEDRTDWLTGTRRPTPERVIPTPRNASSRLPRNASSRA